MYGGYQSREIRRDALLRLLSSSFSGVCFGLTYCNSRCILLENGIRPADIRLNVCGADAFCCWLRVSGVAGGLIVDGHVNHHFGVLGIIGDEENTATAFEVSVVGIN